MAEFVTLATAPARLSMADRRALAGTTVGIEQGNGQLHYINGYVTSIESGGRIVSSYYEDGGKGVAHQYEVTLHSWLWLSDRTANCRIFQHKKVVDILAELFEKIEGDSENLKEALELDAAATRTVLEESYPGLVAKYDKSVEEMRKFDYANLIQTTINNDKNVISKTKKI